MRNTDNTEPDGRGCAAEGNRKKEIEIFHQ